MDETESAFTQSEDFPIKIQNCLLKSLKSGEHLLEPEIVQQIRIKIEEINSGDSIIQSIEYFLFSLINKLQLICQRTSKPDLNTEDYQNLELAIQKSEAEVRKHIRLEQQLKLYMDGLEDKVEELENQLRIQTQKYHQLFQSAKALDLQKRELKKKLKSIEMRYKSHENTSKQMKIISQKASKNLLSEPTMNYSSSNSYYVPSTDKYKLIRKKKSGEKSEQIPKNKAINYTSYKKLIQNDIKVSLNNSPKKKNSMPENPKNLVHKKSPNTSENIDKTIHFKEGLKKPSRKFIKDYAEQNKMKGHKDIRSSSVCQ